METTIGIIGGSGLYDMAELTDREQRTIATPFGEPSGPYVLGTLRGKRVAFLVFSTKEKEFQWFVADVSGGAPQQVTHEKGPMHIIVAWSPDSRRLLYAYQIEPKEKKAGGTFEGARPGLRCRLRMSLSGSLAMGRALVSRGPQMGHSAPPRWAGWANRRSPISPT